MADKVKPLVVNKTLLITSRANGKFLSRLDLDAGSDGVKDFSCSMIPVLSDAIEWKLAYTFENRR